MYQARKFACAAYEDVRWDRLGRVCRLWYDNYMYFARGRTPKLTTVLKLAAARMLQRF